MKERCPRCTNTDLVIKKFTLGERSVTVYDCFCPRCGLLETINCDEAGWSEAVNRWQETDGSPLTP